MNNFPKFPKIIHEKQEIPDSVFFFLKCACGYDHKVGNFDINIIPKKKNVRQNKYSSLLTDTNLIYMVSISIVFK